MSTDFPEARVTLNSLIIERFIDEEGVDVVGFRRDTEPNVTVELGMLELVKDTILAESRGDLSDDA